MLAGKILIHTHTEKKVSQCVVTSITTIDRAQHFHLITNPFEKGTFDLFKVLFKHLSTFIQCQREKFIKDRMRLLKLFSKDSF